MLVAAWPSFTMGVRPRYKAKHVRLLLFGCRVAVFGFSLCSFVGFPCVRACATPCILLPACRAFCLQDPTLFLGFTFSWHLLSSQEAQCHAQFRVLGVSDLHSLPSCWARRGLAFWISDFHLATMVQQAPGPGQVVPLQAWERACPVSRQVWLGTDLRTQCRDGTGLFDKSVPLVSHLMPLGHLSLRFPSLSLPVVPGPNPASHCLVDVNTDGNLVLKSNGFSSISLTSDPCIPLSFAMVRRTVMTMVNANKFREFGHVSLSSEHGAACGRSTLMPTCSGRTWILFLFLLEECRCGAKASEEGDDPSSLLSGSFMHFFCSMP